MALPSGILISASTLVLVVVMDAIWVRLSRISFARVRPVKVSR